METRVCSKCGVEKPIGEFALRNRFTTRRQSYCKACYTLMSKNWYENNKEYQKANAKKHSSEYRANAKEYIWNYLLTHPCVSCGESNPVVLEFHHAKGGKESAIAELVGKGSSLEKLKDEVEKCEVLCANCHRKLTAQERGWFRGKK